MVNLKKIRELRGKKQKQAAQDLGIGISTFSQYETGKREPDNKTLIKLADYFDCSTDFLLGRVDEPNFEIRKAPSEDGAETAYVEVERNTPEFSEDEIKVLWKFLDSQRNR